MGLGLESVVGYEKEGKNVCVVPEWQLRNLVIVANGRFVENKKRIERFRELVRLSMGEGNDGVKERRVGDSGAWESKEERRERKRAEGLRRAREMKENKVDGRIEPKDEEIPDIGALTVEQNL
jgi:tRNA wybutosine-synthesizing protein 3